ncbi:MAG: ExbD/TolR family protein [Candidatus Eremiobacterales bacterium]|jgi:biopolymer transport protein ExbD
MTSATARQDGDVMAEINITPFTDVLLVLVIIFMILASIAVPPGFQKELSSDLNRKTIIDNFARVIDVTVTRAGAISVDGIATTNNGLYAAIANAVAAHERAHLSTHIAIVADADAKYDAIVKILDAGRQAGDDDVGFVTR